MKDKIYVWKSRNEKTPGEQPQLEKLFVKKILRNSEGVVCLIHTDKGPKYFSEVIIPEHVKQHFTQIKEDG